MDYDAAVLAKGCGSLQWKLDSKFSAFEKKHHLLVFGAGEHSEFLFRCLGFSNWIKVHICDNYKK